jgi:hypothetical protein
MVIMMDNAISHGPKPLRDAVRAIYDAVYPTEDWASVGFEEAELLDTIHYRNAVTAARSASMLLSDSGDGRLL